MKLIAVTSPTFFVEEDKIITALFEAGLDILHLRKPETPAMFSERLLTLIPKKYHKRIITHDHFYLKEEFELMGIHLSERNPKPPHSYSGLVGCTCRSLEEIPDKKRFYDYVILSPVFSSCHQDDAEPIYRDTDLLIASKKKIIDSKVHAMGGICADNIKRLKKMDFGGVIVSDDLWKRFDEKDDISYINVIEHFKKLKKLAK